MKSTYSAGNWVVQDRGEDWSALELGVIRTLSNGSKGGNYVHIPPELPGLVLGPLTETSSKKVKGGKLLRVLWMGRVFLAGPDDLRRI